MEVGEGTEARWEETRGVKGNEHTVSHPKVSRLKQKALPSART